MLLLKLVCHLIFKDLNYLCFEMFTVTYFVKSISNRPFIHLF